MPSTRASSGSSKCGHRSRICRRTCNASGRRRLPEGGVPVLARDMKIYVHARGTALRRLTGATPSGRLSCLGRGRSLGHVVASDPRDREPLPEDVVSPRLVDEDAREEDHGDHRHHLEGVRRAGRVVHREVVRRVGGRDHHPREQLLEDGAHGPCDAHGGGGEGPSLRLGRGQPGRGDHRHERQRLNRLGHEAGAEPDVDPRHEAERHDDRQDSDPDGGASAPGHAARRSSSASGRSRP